jgi:hypothetical protein
MRFWARLGTLAAAATLIPISTGGMSAAQSVGPSSPVFYPTTDTPGDFNHDKKTELSVFRPSTGVWWILGRNPIHWGQYGDVPVPRDYDGDGETDIAVYRPSTQAWWWIGHPTTIWGHPGDIPYPENWNGYGRADFATFRISGGWYIHDGASALLMPGRAADDSGTFFPVPADYVRDARTDVSIFYPELSGGWDGTWDLGNGEVITKWGHAGDIPVPGDYNGDGKADIAIWRPSTGQWWIRGRPPVTWGVRGDILLHGDYNGDGKMDIAVWRPSNHTFYIRSIRTMAYGAAGDIPTSSFPTFSITF